MLGSLTAASVFATTFSFLFTTPGVFDDPERPAGFLMKDLILLGGAVVLAVEAARATIEGSFHPNDDPDLPVCTAG